MATVTLTVEVKYDAEELNPETVAGLVTNMVGKGFCRYGDDDPRLAGVKIGVFAVESSNWGKSSNWVQPESKKFIGA